MTTNLLSLFPIIDDPANVLYSKLKQWLLIDGSYHLYCKAVNRTKRIIYCSFKGMTKTYKLKMDMSASGIKSSLNKSLYLGLKFKINYHMSSESTASGYSIPVDWTRLFLTDAEPISVITEYNDNIFISEDTSHPEHYFLCIYVGKIIPFNLEGLDYDSVDIQFSDKSEMKLDFKSAYRRSVGRKLVLYPSGSPSGASLVDSTIPWELYDIDSDGKATLIDASGSTFSSFGYSNLYASQYGPSIDHLSQFTCSYGHTNTSYSITVLEKVFSDKFNNTPLPVFATMYKECEPFCNTLGFSPIMYEYLFRGLKIRDNFETKYRIPLYKETIVLLLEYITNMNLRWLLEPRINSPLWSNLQIIREDTHGNYNNRLSYVLSLPEGSVFNTVFMDEFYGSMDMGVQGSLLYSVARSKYTDLYGYSPEDVNNDLPVVQNAAPTSTIPNNRWYEKELMYLMAFWRYYSMGYKHGKYGNSYLHIPYIYSRINNAPSYISGYISDSSVRQQYLNFFTKSLLRMCDDYETVY